MNSQMREAILDFWSQLELEYRHYSNYTNYYDNKILGSFIENWVCGKVYPYDRDNIEIGTLDFNIVSKGKKNNKKCKSSTLDG